MPLRERARVARRVVDLVLDRREEAMDLVQAESGKARAHALEEVLDIAIVARYYANTAPKVLAPQRRQGALPLLTSTRQLAHPKGVVGIISPWNYPLTLAVTDPLPALLAGNAVVIKPDSQTPLCALFGAELLADAGLPEDLLQVVTGPGRSVGTGIIDRADFVCFTGSTATGRTVAQRAGERLIGASLELGGKNAQVVCEDADVAKAVEGTVRGAFASGGQLCVSVERVLVHRSLHAEFTTRLADRVRAMRVGPGPGWDVEMGSLVSEAQLRTVTEHVEDARARGAVVLAGGKPRPDLGPLFYEPTVLTDVTPDMVCATEETFGPVISVAAFDTDDEAVARANDTSYGLNASVWSRSARHGRAVGERLRAGTVNVNEGYAAAWASVDSPMGGMGESGLSRRHGAEGILKYTEAQTLAVQRLLPVAPPPFLGAQRYADVMSTALRVLARVPFYK